MLARLGAHVRSNIVGYGALCLALSGGTAFAVTQLDENSVRSKHVVNGQIKRADLAAGAAAASAHMDPDTCVAATGPDPCTPEHARGVTAITSTGNGTYCITAPGKDGSTTAAAVTPEYAGTSVQNGEGNASVLQEIPASCAQSEDFGVLTYAYPNVSVRNAANTGGTTALGSAEPSNEVGFSIVIP